MKFPKIKWNWSKLVSVVTKGYEIYKAWKAGKK